MLLLKTRQLWKILFTILFFTLSKPIKSDCVWYGECPVDSDILNCNYDGPPKTIEDDGYKVLREICPELDQGINSTLTCCDLNQLHTLKSHISILTNMVRRCPACDLNLRSFFCQLTCGSNQKDFMRGVVDGKSIIQVNMTVSEPYVQKIINSCRNVKFASAAQNALHVICQKDSQKCQPIDLMRQFSSNSFFPLTIHLNEIGMKSKTWNCNTSIKLPTVSLLPCSCSDCEESCPRECPFQEDTSFKIGNLDGYLFLSLIMAIIIFCSILAYGTISYVYKQFNILETSIDDEITPLVSNESPDNRQFIEMFHFYFSSLCGNVGRLVCRFWWICILFGLISCAILSIGVSRIQLTTDPHILWSVKNSRALKEQNKYDATFGPFYRTTQLILTPKNQSIFVKAYPNDIMTYIFDISLSKENLFKLHRLQSQIENFTTADGVSLHDVCYKPVGDDCAIFSPMEFFQNDPVKLDSQEKVDEDILADWASHLIYCFQSPLSLLDDKLNISCLARYGGPVESFLAVAGYTNDPINCTSLVLTYMLNSTDIRSIEWEKEFLQRMSEYSDSELDVAYSSERSIEDQISEESWTDLRTIIISYTLMFVYVTFALSRRQVVSSNSKWIVDGSKITLALLSICLVLLAVVASVGLFAFLKIPTTLLIFEVIPFLILAIGVDNIFILTRQCQRSQLTNPQDIIVESLQIVGPGLFLASTAEITTFFLAAIFATVYAVRLFALYAAAALLLNIILQIIVFIPLIFIDIMRAKSGRADILFCVKFPVSEDLHNPVSETSLLSNTPKLARFILVVFFLIFPFISLNILGKLPIGLEPSITVPTHSYMHEYLQKIKSLNTGPPVFFVLENMELNESSSQNSICGGSGCKVDSLMAQLAVAEVYSNLSMLFKAPSSWIDGYIDWIGTPGCCRISEGEFCPSHNLNCKMCDVHLDNQRPVGDEFNKFLEFFLLDIPNPQCPFGGQSLYGPAVKHNASYFMGYHSNLKESDDFILALKRSWEIVDRAKQYLKENQSQNINLYSYSIFYVFYEQYLTMRDQLLINITASLSVVFIISFLLTGFNFRVGIAVLITVWMIVMDMIGMMMVWSVTLNAISIVNLIMSIGISVEFCAHIAMNFAKNTEIKCPKKRAANALSEIGSSVFAGIGLTKLIGISVLAFAQSQLFTILFFRMYLCLVLLGITHGMIFLPTLLSLIGAGTESNEDEREIRYVEVFPQNIEEVVS